MTNKRTISLWRWILIEKMQRSLSNEGTPIVEEQVRVIIGLVGGTTCKGSPPISFNIAPVYQSTAHKRFSLTVLSVDQWNLTILPYLRQPTISSGRNTNAEPLVELVPTISCLETNSSPPKKNLTRDTREI